MVFGCKTQRTQSHGGDCGGGGETRETPTSATIAAQLSMRRLQPPLYRPAIGGKYRSGERGHGESA